MLLSPQAKLKKVMTKAKETGLTIEQIFACFGAISEEVEDGHTYTHISARSSPPLSCVVHASRPVTLCPLVWRRGALPLQGLWGRCAAAGEEAV